MIASAGTLSSFRIVTVAVAFPSVAFAGFVSTTVNVSFPSSVTSPFTVTVIVPLSVLGGIVSTPVTAT